MEIILQKGNYALIDRGHEYVVACGFDETQFENQQWEHGIYYSHWNESESKKAEMLSNALNCYREKTEENYNPTRELEIYREDYTEGQFNEMLATLGLNDDEVGDAFMFKGTVVKSTLKNGDE